jgi:hypothetical protein
MLHPKTWHLFAVTISFFGIAWPANMLAHESKPITVAQESEAEQDTPKKIDQTGIKWVLPFSAALEKTKQEKRILAIKMIAFGTDSTGCW